MTGFWENRRHAGVRALLSSYIDGEVSAAESRRVERHLAGCDECAAELESLRATTMLLGRLPLLDAPRSYALTPVDVADAPRLTGLPGLISIAALARGFAPMGAAALALVLIVGVALIVMRGIGGEYQAAAPAPAAAPMAAAPAPAAPAAPAVPQMAAAPAAPQAAPPAPAAPAAQPTTAPAPAPQAAMPAPAAQPTIAPAPAAAMAAPAAAPAAASVAEESEEGAAKEAEVMKAAEVRFVSDAAVEATATAESVTTAQATYEAQVVEAQAAATVTAQEHIKYATAQAQWEVEQAARARERAERQATAQAAYEAQVAEAKIAATAQARQMETRQATRVAALSEAVEAQATESAARGEFAIPVWALVVGGVVALAAAAGIVVWLARRADNANQGG